ncbi:MAG: D-alanyl-D-alanine dipeptidase [Bacteroidia bacterium]|jgi:D-alanyl-D-alanine dipeptidase
MVLFLASNISFFSCSRHFDSAANTSASDSASLSNDLLQVINHEPSVPNDDTLDQLMRKAGMIDVQQINPRILVHLRYQTEDNFLQRNFYGNLTNAYAEYHTAHLLSKAQHLLDSAGNGERLLVWDAARPLHCQQLMWDALDMPFEERTKYVSNPKNHSLHNYGCAVDVTLVDSSGTQLDMGTDFDNFSPLAQPWYEPFNIDMGILSHKQWRNRFKLRTVMKQVGFTSLSSEWWHFNSCSRTYAKEHFRMVE